MENEPIGVSQWKEYGKKYGYWKFFEKTQKQEFKKMVDEFICDWLKEYANTPLDKREGVWKEVVKLRDELLDKLK